jgi:hypothetical protein
MQPPSHEREEAYKGVPLVPSGCPAVSTTAYVLYTMLFKGSGAEGAGAAAFFQTLGER